VTLAAGLSREVPPGQVYLDAETAAALARDKRFALTKQPAIEVRDQGEVSPVLLERALP